MAEQHVVFTVDEGVGIVTLNRPERLNAVNWPMAADLVTLFRELRSRDDVRTIVLTGAGKGFCAGGDAEWLAGGTDRGIPGLSDKPLERYQKKYDSRAKMGTLAFSDLELRPLGVDDVVATGAWTLTRQSDAPHGRFTLIVHRTAAGWRIVYDHSS